jgi:hypothetical protein
MCDLFLFYTWKCPLFWMMTQPFSKNIIVSSVLKPDFKNVNYHFLIINAHLWKFRVEAVSGQCFLEKNCFLSTIQTLTQEFELILKVPLSHCYKCHVAITNLIP